MLYNEHKAQGPCSRGPKNYHAIWPRSCLFVVALLWQRNTRPEPCKFKKQIYTQPVVFCLGTEVWLQRGTPCLGMLLCWHRGRGHQNHARSRDGSDPYCHNGISTFEFTNRIPCSFYRIWHVSHGVWVTQHGERERERLYTNFFVLINFFHYFPQIEYISNGA